MASIDLKIDLKKINTYLKQKYWNGYEFAVNGFTLLPLKAKRKRIPTDQCVLTFEYICPDHISFISILTEQPDIMSRNIATASRWTTFSIDLAECKGAIKHHIRTSYRVPLHIMIAPLLTATTFKIKNIRLRPRTADEQEKAEIQSSYKNRPLVNPVNTACNLYDYVFPNRIDRIEADDTKITWEGTIQTPSPVYLCELPVFKDFTLDNLTVLETAEPHEGRFKISLPRITGQYGQSYDRIYSRWMLVCRRQEQLYICSHARYADHTHTGHSFPVLPPKTRKGIGAFKYNHLYTDLKELGISFITFNIRINNFLRLDPGPENIPFEYNGKTYYANKRKIEKYDLTLRCAAQHGINVSAIILVYPELWSRDPKVGRILEHPEYERGGAYTMPNMTNIDAVNFYAAAIDFLAARYNRPDEKYGRIHRWIVHNEVDAGHVWTNAGHKTALEFMDIYIKSMRLIYYTARKYDANAEVLISLDHFWTGTNEERDCYPSAQLLQILMDYCKAEGDFKWGIAIHPYPENLLEPKSWFDKKAEHTMQTPLVTFKNFEVLDVWIKNPATFYKGQKRTLLLSEQNPNSTDYMETALQEQAAGLAYAWKKMEACSGIDAYMAHSWIDARFEGGLKTGLRKYPDDDHDPYGIKPAWFVFRDAGTPQENETFEFAKNIIGISSWDEIIQTPDPEELQQTY